MGLSSRENCTFDREEFFSHTIRFHKRKNIQLWANHVGRFEKSQIWQTQISAKLFYGVISVQIKRTFLCLVLHVKMQFHFYFSDYDYGAVKLCWSDDEQLSFFERWNPFVSVPFKIFTSHHILYNEKEKETEYYNCDELIASLELGILIFSIWKIIKRNNIWQILLKIKLSANFRKRWIAS